MLKFFTSGFKIPKIDFIHTGDWEVIYLDGELFMQGHTITLKQVLKELGIKYNSREVHVNYDNEEIEFADKLEDTKIFVYNDKGVIIDKKDII